jgi:hypothetical protein
MNYTQLSAYLQSYLETNDAAVIGNIPNFMTLAAARISTDLRSSLIEASTTLFSVTQQPLPDGFLAATLVRHNGFTSVYVTPAVFNSQPDGYVYTILSGQILVSPTPQAGDVIELAYYVAGNEALSSKLPHLFLHGSAMEAELYQGNNADAQQEFQLYQSDLEQANGWDIQSGPISLGGGIGAAAAGGGIPGGGSGGGTPVLSFNGRNGNVVSQEADYSAYFATPSYVDNGLAGKANAVHTQTMSTITDAGTAATANVTTSATDTTAGRVLKVGDFGAGAAAGTALWGNANLVKTTSATDTTAGSILQVGAGAAQLGADVATDAELTAGLATKAGLNTTPSFVNTIEKYTSKGNVAATVTINPLVDGGDVQFVMIANTAVTFTTSGIPAGGSVVCAVTIFGSFAVTWPAGIYWPGGVAPADSNAVYTFQFRNNAGTIQIFGFQSGKGISIV